MRGLRRRHGLHRRLRGRDDHQRRPGPGRRARRRHSTCPLGVHAHQNLSLAVANSIAAYEEGARNLDGTSAGLGAGAGNCPTEILAAVCDKNGIMTGVDPLKLMDLAEEVVRPLMPRQQVIDRAGLLLGYAGVYGSFLLHAERAAERYGVLAGRDPARARTPQGRRRPGGHDHRRRARAGPQARRAGGAGMTRRHGRHRPPLVARCSRPVRDAQPLTHTFTDTRTSTRRPRSRCRTPSCRRASTPAPRVVGAKLGLTSVAKQKQMNVDRAALRLAHRRHADRRRRAAACARRYIQPRCEPEIAFLLGRDLEGPHVTAAHVLAATEAGVPGAIDILDSRYAGYKFTVQRRHRRQRLLRRVRARRHGVDPHGIDLRLTGCVLEKNGELVSTAAGAAVMGHPAARGRLARAHAGHARPRPARPARSSWPAA